MSKLLKLFVGLVVLVLIIGHFSKSDAPSAVQSQATPPPSAAPARTCATGTPTDAKYFVFKKETPFYVSPDKSKGKVVNPRASEILKRTEYRTLWPEMVLQGLCETSEWLQAKIVEADGEPVDWETGWVEKNKVHTDASSDYTAGLIWNIEGETDLTTKEKALVREGALKVLRDEPNCLKITTGYRSGSKKGQYYVTCTAKNGAEPFNVWFSPSDVKSGQSLAIPNAFDETRSRQMCIDAIKSRVNHPSTLDVNTFTGYGTRVANNGNREVIQTFSAKNSFGLELKHRARCLIMPNGDLEITITEDE